MLHKTTHKTTHKKKTRQTQESRLAVTYLVHLPSGVKLPADSGQHLDYLLNEPICRVLPASQIRVEVLYKIVSEPPVTPVTPTTNTTNGVNQHHV